MTNMMRNPRNVEPSERECSWARNILVGAFVVLVVFITSSCVPTYPQNPQGAPGSVVQPAGQQGGFQYYLTPAWTQGRNLTLAVKEPAPSNDRGITVVIAHSSMGLMPADMDLARAYAAQGFTAVAGAWFGGWNGPPFTGQSWYAVNDLSAIVTATKNLYPQPLAIVGISRGAGVAALRATQGHTEPVVLTSGVLSHPLAHPHPQDSYPIHRVQHVNAPMLVWDSTHDSVTPPTQAGYFVFAADTYDKDVWHRRSTGEHGFIYGPLMDVIVSESAAWIEGKV